MPGRDRFICCGRYGDHSYSQVAGLVCFSVRPYIAPKGYRAPAGATITKVARAHFHPQREREASAGLLVSALLSLRALSLCIFVFRLLPGDAVVSKTDPPFFPREAQAQKYIFRNRNVRNMMPQ